MTITKKLMIFALVGALSTMIFTGCGKAKDQTQNNNTTLKMADVNVESGEDYKDNRESKWELKDNNDQRFATIKANRGYSLSEQTYEKVSIAKENEKKEIKVFADITGYPGSLAKDIASVIAEEKKTTPKEEKVNGKPVYVITSGEGAVYEVIYGNDKNCVEIRMATANLDKVGLEYNDAIKAVVDMISF